MESYVKIDWLTLTMKFGDPIYTNEVESAAEAIAVMAYCLPQLGIETVSLEPMVGTGFYPYQFRATDPGLIISVPKDMGKQGIKVEFSGAWDHADLPHRLILHNALMHEWNVTRIDVAVDLFETGIKPRWIFHLYEHLHVGSETQPKYFPGKKGATVYIGSRESDRMLRIYDKGAEQGVDTDWLRVEGEYKGKLAKVVAEQFLANPGTVVEDMRNKLDLPLYALDIFLERLASGEHAKIKSPVKAKSDRERWLYEQVLPALRTLAYTDYDAAAGFVMACQELLDSGAF